MQLNVIQSQQLLKRLPPFELSYETLPHKKVFTSYEIGLAIPTGKKFFAWFSFHNNHDVCYMMELNKEKKISKVSICNSKFNPVLSLGTILYGTVIPIDSALNNIDHSTISSSDNDTIEPVSVLNVSTDKFVYVIEDIFYYKGISMKSIPFGEKLGYIECVLQHIHSDYNTPSAMFVLPYMWGLSSTEEEHILHHYEKIKEHIGYQAHHVQIRKLREISPYLNIVINTILAKINNKTKPASPVIMNKPVLDIMPASAAFMKPFRPDYNKPQYKIPTIFQVTADVQNDIYHLFACGKNKSSVYYGVACIPTIKTSIFMNSLFRKIKENQNIDYIEESDDEDEFENIAEDKYVDLSKVLLIECAFHTKFKKWVPLRLMDDNNKIIHISKLVNEHPPSNGYSHSHSTQIR